MAPGFQSTTVGVRFYTRNPHGAYIFGALGSCFGLPRVHVSGFAFDGHTARSHNVIKGGDVCLGPINREQFTGVLKQFWKSRAMGCKIANNVLELLAATFFVYLRTIA
jgi:hypothetical protein